MKNETKEKTVLEEKPKNLMTKLKPYEILLIIVAVVVAFFILFFVLLKASNKKLTEHPIMFVENGQLILWQKDGNKKTIIDDSFDEDEKDYLKVAYPNKTMGKLLYSTSSEELYLYDVKTNTKEKIASSVYRYGDFMFTKDDSNVIYQDEDDNIYSYDLKSKLKTRIANVGDEESSHIAKLTDDGLFYDILEDGKYKLFFNNLKKDAKSEVIVDNIDYYTFNEDKTRIAYYIEEEDETKSYYIYDIAKKKNDKIFTNTLWAYPNEEYTEFIYAQKSQDAVNILEDDELDNDPVTTVTKKEVCGYYDYRAGKCTREQYYNDEEFEYVVVESKKEVNDEIREVAQEMYYIDIYYYKNGESKKLISNVLDIFGVDAESKTVSFADLATDQTVKISSLKSVEDFEKYVEDNTAIYYQKNTDNAVKLELDANDVDAAYITSKLAGYITMDSGDLYYINIKENANTAELIDNASDATIYKDELLYFITDKNDNYSLKVAQENTVKELATKIEDLEKLDDKLYITHDCNNSSCTYSSYDKEIKQILTDVSYVKRLDDNNYYILKNYSKANDTYDLYRYSDGKLTQIAFDISLDYVSILSIYSEN